MATEEQKERLREEIRKAELRVDAVFYTLKLAEAKLMRCKCDIDGVNIGLDKDDKECREYLELFVKNCDGVENNAIEQFCNLSKIIKKMYGIGNKDLEDLWEGNPKEKEEV